MLIIGSNSRVVRCSLEDLAPSSRTSSIVHLASQNLHREQAQFSMDSEASILDTIARRVCQLLRYSPLRLARTTKYDQTILLLDFRKPSQVSGGQFHYARNPILRLLPTQSNLWVSLSFRSLQAVLVVSRCVAVCSMTSIF